MSKGFYIWENESGAVVRLLSHHIGHILDLAERHVPGPGYEKLADAKH